MEAEATRQVHRNVLKGTGEKIQYPRLKNLMHFLYYYGPSIVCVCFTKE